VSSRLTYDIPVGAYTPSTLLKMNGDLVSDREKPKHLEELEMQIHFGIPFKSFDRKVV
jgi:hypothetical protein